MSAPPERGRAARGAIGWPSRLLLATHNEGKAREFAALLPGHVEITTSRTLGLASPPEEGGSYLANARLKAAHGAKVTGLPTLADDTGAELDALDGAPGVDTASWVEAHGGWEAALRAVAEHVGLVPGVTSAVDVPRGVTLCCALVLRWPDGAERSTFARVRGELRWPPSGPASDGFATLVGATSSDVDMSARDVQPHRQAAFASLDAALRGA